jgi:L-asparaginase II
VNELDLLCGVHIPGDVAAAESLRERKELPTPNQHNCSGKHTGMLAYAQMSNRMYKDLPYISPQHPIQLEILSTVAEMCGLTTDQVALGVDGCSAPNFAVPLRNAALAYARLSDPGRSNLPPQRTVACRLITAAMMSEPEMVAGPGKFDTRLMQVTRGKLVCKGGAEGYQGIGLMPGALAPGSPALGITLKIADGDERGRVRQAVALEALRQLGVLSPEELRALSEFGPVFPVFNWRMILAGEGRPAFELQHES